MKFTIGSPSDVRSLVITKIDSESDKHLFWNQISICFGMLLLEEYKLENLSIPCVQLLVVLQQRKLYKCVQAENDETCDSVFIL